MAALAVPGTGLVLSRLGFGCARLFGGGEFAHSARLLEAALDAGIHHFDTAPSYGSEDVLGEVLAGVPGVTVATKVGLPRAPDVQSPRRSFVGSLYRRTLRPLLTRFPAVKARALGMAARASTPSAQAPVMRSLSRDDVLRELEQSLKRLRRGRIDLYLLHEPDHLRLPDEVLDLFAALQRDGVVGAYGYAYGGRPSLPGVFGAVEQCRYAADLPAPARGRQVRIVHGVVRQGAQRQVQQGHRVDAAQLVRDVLQSHDDCAVLISASSARQIRQLAAACQDPVPADDTLPSTPSLPPIRAADEF